MCLVTSVRLECKNKASCTHVALQAAASAEHVVAKEDSASRKRNTDCAANAQHVPAFLSSGDGGTEAARLNGMLGLLNATHMQNRSFGETEKQMSSNLEQLTEELILVNLDREASTVLGDETDGSGNKLTELWRERSPPRQHWPCIRGLWS